MNTITVASDEYREYASITTRHPYNLILNLILHYLTPNPNPCYYLYNQPRPTYNASPLQITQITMPVLKVVAKISDQFPCLTDVLYVQNITGTISSQDPKYPFEAVITSGHDVIRTTKSGQTAILDAVLVGYLKDSDKKFLMKYSGHLNFSPELVEVLTGKKTEHGPPGNVKSFGTIELDEEAKDDKESWVVGQTMVGNGRFFRDGEDLFVEYLTEFM